MLPSSQILRGVVARRAELSIALLLLLLAALLFVLLALGLRRTWLEVVP